MANYPGPIPPNEPPVDDMPGYLPSFSGPNIPSMANVQSESPMPNPGADLVPGVANVGMSDWQASPPTYPPGVAIGGKND